MNKKKSILIITCFWSCLSFCQSSFNSVKLSVIQDNAILKFNFSNKGEKPIEIPNYYLLSIDTAQQMKVLPKSILEVKGDTLLISTFHRDTLIGNKDTLKSYGIEISHQESVAKVFRTKGLISVKRKNKQILRLPSPFDSMNFKYCKVIIDGKTLVVGKVK
jgi:hypothetical protein